MFEKHLEKYINAALMPAVMSMGYLGITNSMEPAIDEAQTAAIYLQERELKNALEIYYAEHNSYPTSKDEQMVKDLYSGEYLESSKVPFIVTYHVPRGGQKYNLMLN